MPTGYRKGTESSNGFTGADPGIFVRGVQPSEKNFDKQKKKKTTTHRQKGRGRALQYLFCITTLERSKSILAIEIAFKIIIFHKMTSPVFSSWPTQNTFDMVVLAL